MLSHFSHVWLFLTPWISSPGSFVCGIPQARILGWFAISFSRASSWPRDWTHNISCIGRWILCLWVTREAPEDPITKKIIAVLSLSRVWLLATPWTVACQAFLSKKNYRSFYKFTSVLTIYYFFEGSFYLEHINNAGKPEKLLFLKCDTSLHDKHLRNWFQMSVPSFDACLKRHIYKAHIWTALCRECSPAWAVSQNLIACFSPEK